MRDDARETPRDHTPRDETPDPLSPAAPLFLALQRLAQLQRETVDSLTLQEAVRTSTGTQAGTTPRDARATLRDITRHLGVRPARWSDEPDAAAIPALIHDPKGRWGLLRGRNAGNQWVCEWLDDDNRHWLESSRDTLHGCQLARLSLRPPYQATNSPFLRIIRDEILSHRKLLGEVLLAGFIISLLTALTSFYSMQVYDRVIPGGALQTLMVLTLGVLAAVAFEYLTRRARTHLNEQLIEALDLRLSRLVYLRFLSIRVDQLPASVGSLASQLRGYELVRNVVVGLAGQALVDAPFALLFLVFIYAIAGPLALVPLAFLAAALCIGFFHAARIRQLGQASHENANLKTGLLVESVEAAEIIKSGQGGWRMLNRWLGATEQARDVELQMRRISESAQHLAMAFQQVSYIGVMAFGAWMATRGDITLGTLIACAILSGRVLSPVTQLTTHWVSWGQAKAALEGLDRLWALEGDHHGVEEPVVLDRIAGHYHLENVTMDLAGKPALVVPSLSLEPGARVAVLGMVGAGKSTLLRLLSGLYKPKAGRVMLDDVDMQALSRPLLAAHIGYLPQDGRLLSGTLRDNLLLGLMDPGDEAILAAARKTGLFDTVIKPHPQGLQQQINEGGTGLSGGQRQLVNLTRVFLRKPRIWLLDEPCASLDHNLEMRVLQALRETVQPEDLLVLVTHRPDLLQLVDRVIIVMGNRLVMDGPRDLILAKLQAPAASRPPQGGGA